MPRWSRLILALVLALGGCRPREPVYGPLPIPRPAPPPRPAPAPAPAPREPEEPGPAPPAARSAPPVRVGLVVDAAAGEVSSLSGLSVETEDGRNLEELDAGSSLAFSADRGTVAMEVRDRSGRALRTRRGLDPPVVVRAADGGAVVVRGVPYRGAILVQAAGRSGLTLVNRLDLESYLLGVVPREIGRASEDVFQAVKAQAVAARTYAVRYMGRRSQLGFDVYPTVEDQVYGGVPAENEIVTRAVRETAGEILTWRGEPITAYYHSTCAGQTAAVEEVWSGSPVPYLVSVVDTDARGEAYDRSSSRFRWTERWTERQLAAILNRTLADSLRGGRITRIEGMDVTRRTPSGRVRSLVIDTDAGRFTVGRDRVRWILAPARGGILNSSRFDVRREGDDIVAEGGGWGHGVGMCQVGAMGRARDGQDYRTILGTYYPGTGLSRAY